MNYGYIKSKLDGTEAKFSVIPGLDIPKEYSYVPYLPKVLNQGNEAICVPCSISAHLNWNCNIDTGDNKKDNHIDLHQIYKQRTNEGDGMTIKEALHFLKHEGVKSDEGILKIRKYALVNSELALKQALLTNGPCVAGLLVYSDGCRFWESNSYNELLGGHAVSIVGWNQKGFIIRNSWGTSFCDKGYTLLPYKNMNSFTEIWTIID